MSKTQAGTPVPNGCSAIRDEVPAFLVDRMLGRLARWLRTLGYDTWYIKDLGDIDWAGMRETTGRILLTRDAGRVRKHRPGRYLLIEHDRWEAQVQQVVNTLGLAPSRERCFTRCLQCNDLLEEVDAAAVRERVPDHISAVHIRFRGCPSCQRVFWRGTHRHEMDRWLERSLLCTPS